MTDFFWRFHDDSFWIFSFLLIPVVSHDAYVLFYAFNFLIQHLGPARSNPIIRNIICIIYNKYFSTFYKEKVFGSFPALIPKR